MKKVLLLVTFGLLLAACEFKEIDSPDSQPEPTPPAAEESNASPDSQDPTQEGMSAHKPSMKLAEGAEFELPEGTFTQMKGDFEGEVFVKGYAKVLQVDEAFCTENCKKYDYVSFNIVESNNDDFTQFLNQDDDGTGAVGLGCVAEGKIYYSNESVETGMRDYELSEPLTQVILDSTKEHPIILKLSRKPAVGMGAPACYSHFMTVDQLAV